MAAPYLGFVVSVTTNNDTTYAGTILLRYHGNGETWNEEAPYTIKRNGTTIVNSIANVTKSNSWQDVYSLSFSFSKSSSAVSYAYRADMAVGSTVYADPYCTTTVTVPAKAETRYVYYNANGGMGEPDTQSFIVGSSTPFYLSDIVPVRKNYNFQGWALSSSATSGAYSPGQRWSTTNSTYTLYAVWKKQTLATYTITYDKNGGNPVPVEYQTKIEGRPMTIDPQAIATRGGYPFEGWYLKDGTSTVWQPGYPFTLDGNRTLYAKWGAELNVTLHYDLNYTDAPDMSEWDQSIGYWNGGNWTVRNDIPTRSGEPYTFLCWTTNKDGSGTQYTGGSTITNNHHDVTLYAQWQTCTIYYYFADHITSPQTLLVSQGSNQDLWSSDIPDWGDYEFSGYWESISSPPSSNNDLRKTDSILTGISGNNYTSPYNKTKYTITWGSVQRYKAVYKRKSNRLPSASQPIAFYMRTNESIPYTAFKTMISQPNGESVFASKQNDAGDKIYGYVRFTTAGSIYNLNFSSGNTFKVLSGSNSSLMGLRTSLGGTITSTISSGSGGYTNFVFYKNYIYIYSEFSGIDDQTRTISTVITNVPTDYGSLVSANLSYTFKGTSYVLDINASGSVLSLGGKAVDEVSNALPVPNYTQTGTPPNSSTVYQGTTGTPKAGVPATITAIQNPLYVKGYDDNVPLIPAITEGIVEDEVLMYSRTIEWWKAILSGQSPDPGRVVVNSLSVTQNGTYTAPAGQAYSPVTVNVSGGMSARYDSGVLILE